MDLYKSIFTQNSSFVTHSLIICPCFQLLHSFIKTILLKEVEANQINVEENVLAHMSYPVCCNQLITDSTSQKQLSKLVSLEST